MLSTRRIFLIIICVALFFLVHVARSWSSPSYEELSGRAIISLASSHHRLDNELPVAIRSLTRQAASPREIRVYFPESDKAAVQARLSSTPGSEPLSAWLLHHLVKMHFVQDVGPATKFVPVLTDMMDKHDAGDRDALDQPLIIVDDDHSYSPNLVATLLSIHDQQPFVAVGLRGWRIRSDLEWGVSWDEMDRHVQYGYRLAEPYRVGVLTANEGYLVTPRMFLPPKTSTSYSPISKLAPILDIQKLMSSSAHLVDDIWMAGSLATQGVMRYIVPLPGSPSLDVTTTHTLEKHMESEGKSRGGANTETLHMFSEAFSKEKLWYRFEKDVKGAKGVVSPATTEAEQEPVWISTAARLRKEVAKNIEKAKLMMAFRGIHVD
ncbi:hypothetical protein HGRIS_011486 [Hohenbuehelia grisea]|uniref:Glycosyltransferase family 31 protein n=1 Tax=Hohenbuehelia grisea TaxID=104357 RepID=A0ABR3JWL2_9AGAR